MKGPSLMGGRGRRGQPLLMRCLYCGEDWPETEEFYPFVHGKRHGRKCKACRTELERKNPAPRLCPTCLAVRTKAEECHGCAGRIAGDMSGAWLVENGFAGVRQ